MPRKTVAVKASKSSQKAVEKALRAACPVRFLGVLEEQVGLWGVNKVVLCCYCRRPAPAYVRREETECNGCHEFTSRLGAFLREGGAAAADMVRKALAQEQLRLRAAHGYRPSKGDATEALTQALSSDVGSSEGDELASRVWDHGDDWEP